MRYKRQSFFLCISLALTLMFLSICSKSAKSEKNVAKDLQADSRFFSAAEIQITDFTISKRQTATESRRDMVWITVLASNDDISCELSYIMTYNIYNSGWLIDDVERDYEGKWEVNPLHGINEAMINESMASYTEDLFTSMEEIDRSTDLESHMDVVTYIATKDHKYGNETMKVDEIFYFDSNSCCYYPAAELSIYDRSITLKDTIVGAEWECNRYHDKFDPWPDHFSVEVTELYEENGNTWVTFVINRERNTYWGGNEPVYWGVQRSFVVSDYINYLETEYKWGFNMQSSNGFLYSENDNEQFTENEWFCFDLDYDGVGYFAEYYLTDNSSEYDANTLEVQ